MFAFQRVCAALQPASKEDVEDTRVLSLRRRKSRDHFALLGHVFFLMLFPTDFW